MTQTQHEVASLQKFAMETVRQAGEEARAYYGKGNLQRRFDTDLVTEAELHLTRFFQKELHTYFPEHQLFQDNKVNSDYTHEEKRYLWIFDPVDGSANFQAGIPIWGMSLALVENFWPIFGIYYMPITGDLFHAQAGRIAFHGEKPICVASHSTVNDESILFTYARFNKDYRCSFPGKVRDLGCTGAHMCYVAMGRAEAALISNASYQDLAATRVIVESAGGKIHKMDGNVFFLNEYLNGHQVNEHLLVGAPDICSRIPKLLKRES